MHAAEDTWLDFLEIDCLTQDLFSIEADVVAIPVNVMLNLNYTLGRTLAQRGGPELIQRVQDAARAIPDLRMTLGTATSVATEDLPLSSKRSEVRRRFSTHVAAFAK